GREHETGTAAAGNDLAAALVGALGDRDRDDAGRRALGDAGDDARISIERGRFVIARGRGRGLRRVSVGRGFGIVDSLEVEHARPYGAFVQARKRRVTAEVRCAQLTLAPRCARMAVRGPRVSTAATQRIRRTPLADRGCETRICWTTYSV